jgi:hypothetical protein
MVIVAIRYMALALDAYRHTDPRTITDLFEMAKREVINQMINSALTVIIDCLFEVVREMFHPTKEQMEKMYILFYEKLPTYWKNRFNDPAMAA